MDLLLIGPPGVGKGTQSTVLAQRFGLTHLASGDIFRANIRGGTELGLRAKAFVERGELVPDDLVADMMLDRVLSLPATLLDGFPRSLGQAAQLSAELEKAGRRIDAAILLTAPARDLLRRIVGRETCPLCQTPYNVYYRPSRVEATCDLCGFPLQTRADDNLETAQHRLDVYEAQTRPLAEYYGELGVLHAIDGAGDPDDVAALIAAAVTVATALPNQTERTAS